MKKKTTALILAAVMMLCLALAACGIIDTTTTTDNGKKPAEKTETGENSGGKADDPKAETFDSGNVLVTVPGGWKAWGASDVFKDYSPEYDHDPNGIELRKGAKTDLDQLTTPGMTIKYYGYGKKRPDMSKSFYDDAEDLSPMTIGSRVWEGFTGKSFGDPVAALWTEDGFDKFTVFVMLEKGGKKISLDDADVQTILKSVAPTNPIAFEKFTKESAQKKLAGGKIDIDFATMSEEEAAEIWKNFVKELNEGKSIRVNGWISQYTSNGVMECSIIGNGTEFRFFVEGFGDADYPESRSLAEVTGILAPANMLYPPDSKGNEAVGYALYTTSEYVTDGATHDSPSPEPSASAAASGKDIVVVSDDYGDIKLTLPSDGSVEVVKLAQPGEPDYPEFENEFYYFSPRAFLKGDGFAMAIGYQIYNDYKDDRTTGYYYTWDAYRKIKTKQDQKGLTYNGNECWTYFTKGHVGLMFPATTVYGGRVIAVYPENGPDVNLWDNQIREYLELPAVESILDTLELIGENKNDQLPYPLTIDNDYYTFTVESDWELLSYTPKDCLIVTFDKSKSIDPDKTYSYGGFSSAFTIIKVYAGTAEKERDAYVAGDDSRSKGDNITINGITYLTINVDGKVKSTLLYADRPPKSDGSANGCVRIEVWNTLPDAANTLLATLELK